MTVVALQARVRSVELDGKDQRAALEKIEALQESLASVVDRLTKRVDDLADAGGDKAAERIAAMEARVAETTRMQLELAQHDDRIEALEEASGDAASGKGAPSEELRALEGRIGAVEATLTEGAELARRLEAAEVGLADARAELKQRDAQIEELLRRLAALEGESSQEATSVPKTDPPAAAESEPVSVSELASESGLAGPPVALTDVKGIGPKLSKKLAAAGLEDARVLAAMDDDALDGLAEASGIKRGRLERLRDAAAAL